MDITENKGPGFTAGCIIVTVAAVLAVILRAYSQRLNSKAFRLDEFFLLTALLCTIGLCIETCLCFRWGAGRHMMHIMLTDPEPLVNQRKYWKAGYASVVNWAICMFLIKCALLAMYQRIFVNQTSNKAFKWASYAVIFYVIASSVSIIFAYIFICSPISHWWDQINAIGNLPVPAGECPNLIARGLACAVLNVVSDLLTLSLGIMGLWRLQMDRARKFMVGGILSLGSMCCIVSISRIPLLLSATFDDDATWSNANSLLIGVLEAAIGVICASLPGLAPLVRHIRGEVQSRRGISKNSGDSSNSASRTYSRKDLPRKASTAQLAAAAEPHDIHGPYVPMDDFPARPSHQTHIGATQLSPKQVATEVV